MTMPGGRDALDEPVTVTTLRFLIRFGRVGLTRVDRQPDISMFQKELSMSLAE